MIRLADSGNSNIEAVFMRRSVLLGERVLARHVFARLSKRRSTPILIILLEIQFFLQSNAVISPEDVIRGKDSLANLKKHV